MDKSDFYSGAKIAGGTYIGYQALKHGLPRMLGVRIEYHVTSKQNAALIRKSGNILDPLSGGKNGWGQKVNNDRFINNSQNFVHITGLHENSDIFNEKPFNKFRKFKAPLRTIGRKMYTFMYQVIGRGKRDNLCVPNEKGIKRVLQKIKIISTELICTKFSTKTKCFCIPGTDSYFNSEFISDIDDFFALKSAKPVKVYNNRFSAMLGGLKRFGLKGIPENKSRVLVGTGVCLGGLYCGGKLINNGLKNILTSTPNNI